MPAYLVTLDRSKSGHTLPEGVDAMVVFAADGDAAKAAAAACYPGDGRAFPDDATAVEITAADDWAGWTFRVDIFGGFGEDDTDPVAVEYTALAEDDIDAVGAALETALNGIDGIANAAYNDTTNVLTIAGSADGLGDQSVGVSATPPNGSESVDVFGTVTHEGDAGDALAVELPGDSVPVPTVAAVLRQV